MSSLTLLGTIHRDPRGLAKLVKSLSWLAPSVITLELSAYGLRYRLKEKRSLTTRLLRSLHEIKGTDDLTIRELKEFLRSTGIGGIRALLDLPFEYKGARFYSQSRGVPLYCLDISSLSRRLLNDINKLLSPENLKKVLAFESAPLQATVIQEYNHAVAHLLKGRQPSQLPLLPTDAVWGKRERIMARRIRKILARYPGQAVVHVSGWQHLVARQGTLFNLLEDLKPRRVLLYHLDP